MRDTLSGNRRRGLTLIEILIALIVLMVGLVGIFALFPVGMRSTQESVEDSTAALLAESVHHAIVAGMRSSRPASGPADRVPVVLTHDGGPGRAWDGRTTHNATTGTPAGPLLPQDTYVFQLPSESDGGAPLSYPTPGTGSTDVPGANLLQMAGMGVSGAPSYVRRSLVGAGTLVNPTGGSVRAEDPTEPLNQYQVAFVVARVRDAAGTYAQPLFEVSIRVFRNGDLRKTFRTMVAGM